MQNKIKLFFLIIALCISIRGFCSESYEGNRLIIGKDTFNLYFSISHFLSEKLKESNLCFWGPYYEITWDIENDSLFLVDFKIPVLINCQNLWILDSIHPNSPDMKELFSNKIKNGRVYADWVTDTIQINIGESGAFFRLGSHVNEHKNYYQKEKVIIINKGKIIQIKDYINEDKKGTKLSIFDENSFDSLIIVLNKNINWKALPIENVDWCYVMLILTISKNGETTISLYDESSLKNGGYGEGAYEEEKKFNDEVNRILKDIKWKPIYKRGKPIEVSIVIDIEFNFKNKLVINPYIYTEPY
jgi:hypothetical protein